MPWKFPVCAQSASKIRRFFVHNRGTAREMRREEKSDRKKIPSANVRKRHKWYVRANVYECYGNIFVFYTLHTHTRTHMNNVSASPHVCVCMWRASVWFWMYFEHQTRMNAEGTVSMVSFGRKKIGFTAGDSFGMTMPYANQFVAVLLYSVAVKCSHTRTHTHTHSTDSKAFRQ